MLPRRRPTTLRACGVFARRSLPVVPSFPLAVWAGCPSLLRSVRLWITGTNVVEWDSRQVTRSTVPRCEVQVVMITPGYALAPLTGTPGPANARPGSVGPLFIRPEMWITRPPSQPYPFCPYVRLRYKRTTIRERTKPESGREEEEIPIAAVTALPMLNSLEVPLP
ncbi:hypothetical protein Dimus_037202 [Dionaea muscipula]